MLHLEDSQMFKNAYMISKLPNTISSPLP